MHYEKKQIILGDWQDVSGDKTLDLVLCALRGIETREGERRGWDKPPNVYTLHRLHPDREMMEIRIIPRFKWHAGQDNPADDLQLQAMAANMRLKAFGPIQPVTPISFDDSPDGLAAVAFMCEVWGADETKLSKEDKRLQAIGKRTIYRNPHRIEMRLIFAADINGNGYMVWRERGQNESIAWVQDPSGMVTGCSRLTEDMQGFSGRVVTSVTMLALAARLGVWPV